MGSGKMNGGLSVSQMGWQVKTGRAWKEKWPFATIMTLTICTLWGKMGIGIDENGNPFETSMLPVQEHVLANGERWISEGYSNEYGYETAMFEVPVLDEELQIGAVYVEVEMQKYYTG